ncbi:MAG TPA: NAD-dependent epimerase/dehydratase family protein [Phycisphaerae bacterium]|nr:NAD-dependent epimerase/dehydratase family protein [Phycisphaerae bacterium]
MHAFVTGASGFIGRRLVQQLVRQGHRVTALLHRDAQELPTAVATVRSALEDGPGRLAEAMAGHDTVFHLAAQVSFDPRKLPELLRVNGEGTQAVLAAAREAGVARTVVVSSACTIGLSDRADRVLDEDVPFELRLETRNPYLQSKRVTEAYAVEAAQRGQWVTIVNPSTVFGPGDRSLNSGTLVRQVALSPAVPVPPGGSNVVDVDDVADGIVAASLRGQPGRRYILGGVNLRFREIVDRIAGVIGRRPILIPLPSAARYPMTLAAWLVQRVTGSRLITPQIINDTFAFKFYSSHRAEAELGWQAKRDFTATVAAAWEYYRHENLIALPGGVAA